jgi:hypothetical protein
MPIAYHQLEFMDQVSTLAILTASNILMDQVVRQFLVWGMAIKM